MAQRVVINTSRKQINAIRTSFTRSYHYSASSYFNEQLKSPRIQTYKKISPIIKSSSSLLHTTSILYEKEISKEKTTEPETYEEKLKEIEEITGEKLEEWENANSTFDGRIWAEDYKPGEEIPYVQLPPIDDGSGKVLVAPHVRAIAEDMLQLNMFELFQLVTMMGKYYGFDMTQAANTGGGAASEEKEEEVKVEEKTAFDLKLTGFDAKSKIKVIKEIRSITALGLKEAKDLVEGAPKVIKKDIKKEEAEELKAKIEAVGGTVEIE